VGKYYGKKPRRVEADAPSGVLALTSPTSLEGGRSAGKRKGTTYPYLGAAFFYTDWSSDASGTMVSFRIGALHMLSGGVGFFGEGSYDIESMNTGYGDFLGGNVFNLGTGFTIFLN
jgi:hypothetical protein